MILRLPKGYKRIEGISPLAVAHERYTGAIADILRGHTLHQWASRHPDRREYQGRGRVYSAPILGDGPRVVVRHAWHGGLLAPILRDVWLPPTPAASELLISAVLARAGVPTPPIVGFATYPAAVLLRRVDVVTLEIEGLDLATTIGTAAGADRAPVHRALARLLAAMLDAGAWHQDLNAKNVLLSPSAGGELQAVLLDVDRVRFVPAGDPHMAAANTERLRRSMQKFHARGEPALTDEDFAEIERLLGHEEARRANDRATALEEYMPWE
ncbi:MAG: hypothetical protein IT361_09270 [Gemmatimonadaceae bacterium]|nr:hypothetical protein [Gemmatimonadaceae bacterium]